MTLYPELGDFEEDLGSTTVYDELFQQEQEFLSFYLSPITGSFLLHKKFWPLYLQAHMDKFA